jgi:hypothetical protein
MLDFLANMNTTIGLYENIIFDAVGEAEDSATYHKRPISAEVEVDATAFNVNCGLLPQARQNGTQANTTVWNIITSLEDSSPRFIPAPIRLLSKTDANIVPMFLNIPQHAMGSDFFPICKEILTRPG